MYDRCERMTRHPLVFILAIAALILSMPGQLLAQAIDTTKLEKSTPLPPVKHKGVDPGSITTSGASTMSIAGVSVPTVAQTSQVSIQGRGQVRRTELSYFVSVRNDGTAEENYQILTEVHGAAATNRSPRNRLLPGKVGRQNIRFVTEFSLPAGSTQLPFSVLLLDGSGVVIDRTDRQVDMREALGSMTARPGEPVTRTRDLAITNLEMSYRRARLDIGPVNVDRVRKLQAAATVQNAGSERWGYPASLTISYQRGRPPGALSSLTGSSGTTQPQTFALSPGAQTIVMYDAPDSLTPGYYYTATAQVTSRDDQNRENDSRQFVFFLETDGRITPVSAE